MRSISKTGWRSAAALALFLAVLGILPAQALDFNDVQNLLRNQVPESTIINMVAQAPALTLTPDQAAVLRSLGASETLIASIRPAAAAQNYGYDEDGNIVYFDSSTGQVLSTVPQDDQGTAYYDAPSPVIINPAPTIVYESPTYVYPRSPSWGISIDIGRDRRHHGYRPYPRPPYPRPYPPRPYR